MLRIGQATKYRTDIAYFEWQPYTPGLLLVDTIHPLFIMSIRMWKATDALAPGARASSCAGPALSFC